MRSSTSSIGTTGVSVASLITAMSMHELRKRHATQFAFGRQQDAEGAVEILGGQLRRLALDLRLLLVRQVGAEVAAGQEARHRQVADVFEQLAREPPQVVAELVQLVEQVQGPCRHRGR